MGLGQLTGRRVELRRDRHPGIALAHHRLHEERLDEEPLGVRRGEGRPKGVHVVGLHGDQVVPAAEGGQVLLVRFPGGVGELGRPTGAPVKATRQGDLLYGFAGVTAVRVRHHLGVDV